MAQILTWKLQCSDMEQDYTQYAYSYRSNGIKLLAKFVFRLSAFRLDTRSQTGAPLFDCCINNTLVKFIVTTRWERRYTLKAVDNYGTTSRSIISCLGPEIFVQINRILTKFWPRKVRVPLIMAHRVVFCVLSIQRIKRACLLWYVHVHAPASESSRHHHVR